MGVEKNKAVAIAFLQSISARSPDMALVTDDFSFWMPTRGRLEKAQFESLSAGLQAKLAEPLMWDIQHVTAEDDRVSIEAVGTATLAGGSPFRNDYHVLFLMSGGRIVQMREYNNSIVAAAAFSKPAASQK
jgi:ketosteroid isomerase-like protein